MHDPPPPPPPSPFSFLFLILVILVVPCIFVFVNSCFYSSSIVLISSPLLFLFRLVIFFLFFLFLLAHPCLRLHLCLRVRLRLHQWSFLNVVLKYCVHSFRGACCFAFSNPTIGLFLQINVRFISFYFILGKNQPQQLPPECAGSDALGNKVFFLKI